MSSNNRIAKGGAVLLLLGAAVLLTAPNSHAESDWSSCAEVFERKIGGTCGSRDSASIRIRNRCTESIDAKFCLERTNGDWDCGMSFLKSGDTAGYYTCHSTGRVWSWARQAGSRVKAPDPG